MDVEKIINALSKKYGGSMKVNGKYFRDFNGCVVPFGALPEHVKGEREVLMKNNLRNAGNGLDSVSAVVIVKKGGKVIAKFYGENRMATPREYINMMRWYPRGVKTVHAEYDAVLNFIGWYTWKEPSKRRKYSYDVVVVRNGGDVPSRPCPGCRKMMREILGHARIYYPIGLGYWGLENID